jgi:hypothetical protein
MPAESVSGVMAALSLIRVLKPEVRLNLRTSHPGLRRTHQYVEILDGISVVVAVGITRAEPIEETTTT